MKVIYNKSEEIAEAHLETKDGKPVVFRFKYMGDDFVYNKENYEDESTIIDCETVCPLAKAGINCEKLAHPEKKRKGFDEICAKIMIEYENLLPPEQFSVDKEFIKSTYFLPVLDKDFKEYYSLSID